MSNINPISSFANEQNVMKFTTASQKTGFTNALSQKLNVPSSLDAIFEEASQTYQVPSSLLKAVAKAESNFDAKAVSKAGAQGVMQLMPATAKSLGVKNSFDARENIMGGAKYLSQMLRKYDGDVKLALAAYNAGSNNVDKYDGVPPFKETQNYVVKVMKYAGGVDTVSAPSSKAAGNAVSGGAMYGENTYYNSIIKNILDFDGYSTDDYLLFLEILKSGMDSSSLLSNWNNSSLYQGDLFSSRIQTLF